MRLASSPVAATSRRSQASRRPAGIVGRLRTPAAGGRARQGGTPCSCSQLAQRPRARCRPAGTRHRWAQLRRARLASRARLRPPPLAAQEQRCRPSAPRSSAVAPVASPARCRPSATAARTPEPAPACSRSRYAPHVRARPARLRHASAAAPVHVPRAAPRASPRPAAAGRVRAARRAARVAAGRGGQRAAASPAGSSGPRPSRAGRRQRRPASSASASAACDATAADGRAPRRPAPPQRRQHLAAAGNCDRSAGRGWTDPRASEAAATPPLAQLGARRTRAAGAACQPLANAATGAMPASARRPPPRSHCSSTVSSWSSAWCAVSSSSPGCSAPRAPRSARRAPRPRRSRPALRPRIQRTTSQGTPKRAASAAAMRGPARGVRLQAVVDVDGAQRRERAGGCRRAPRSSAVESSPPPARCSSPPGHAAGRSRARSRAPRAGVAGVKARTGHPTR